MYFGTSYLSIVIYKLVVYTIMINVSCTLNDASFNIFRIMIEH